MAATTRTMSSSATGSPSELRQPGDRRLAVLELERDALDDHRQREDGERPRTPDSPSPTVSGPPRVDEHEVAVQTGDDNSRWTVSGPRTSVKLHPSRRSNASISTISRSPELSRKRSPRKSRITLRFVVARVRSVLSTSSTVARSSSPCSATRADDWPCVTSQRNRSGRSSVLSRLPGFVMVATNQTQATEEARMSRAAQAACVRSWSLNDPWRWRSGSPANAPAPRRRKRGTFPKLPTES